MTDTFIVVANLTAETTEPLAKKTNVGSVPLSRKLSEKPRLLIATHKDLSQIRRDSLRSSVAGEFRTLSHAQQFQSTDSTECPFGTDLARKAKQVSKPKTVSYTHLTLPTKLSV